MKFTAMYIDIDDKFYKQSSTNPSYVKYIKGISIAEYTNTQLISAKSWRINPPTNNKTDTPYLHECWKEIEPFIYNRTIITFLGNFAIENLVKTHKYILTHRIDNPECKEGCDEEIPKKIPKFPNAFNDCIYPNIHFEYLCLFEICSNLFINDHNHLPAINNFEDLCKSSNISLDDKNKAVAIGELFIKILKSTNTTDILDLKHIAGITFGEVRKSISYRKVTKKKGNTEINDIVEYDKMYQPCLPIIDGNLFKKFTFDLDKYSVDNYNNKG